MARPRSAASQEAIHRATVELLESEGWQGLSVEGIAAAAGVGKATIYRWYDGDVGRIVVEAYLGVSDQRVPPPDTGSAIEDLLAILVPVASLNARRDAGLALANRSLMAHAQLSGSFAEEYGRLHAAWREPMRTALRRGVERGELVADLDVELVIDLLLGQQWYRLLVGHLPTTEADVRRAVDLVLGAAARSSSGPSRSDQASRSPST